MYHLNELEVIFASYLDTWPTKKVFCRDQYKLGYANVPGTHWTSYSTERHVKLVARSCVIVFHPHHSVVCLTSSRSDNQIYSWASRCLV